MMMMMMMIVIINTEAGILWTYLHFKANKYSSCRLHEKHLAYLVQYVWKIISSRF